MARKPLKEYFDSILNSIVEDCEIGGYDREGYDYRLNYIFFEKDGYLIEGQFELAADLIEDGDGYWTPYTIIVRHVSINGVKVEVSWCDPETDEEEEVPAEEIQALESYLEKNIPDAVEG